MYFIYVLKYIIIKLNSVFLLSYDTCTNGRIPGGNGLYICLNDNSSPIPRKRDLASQRIF